ncbi:NADPH-dependent 1-acyldihydroxyacetone phosphate reductase [Erysiphe neolycopersici]|uniref:NADPH-dependent 1-acyldihydroxyacetone phosphate reductase n=1 Tax=Erysiphe neolycopersici TaxID=212602 RepID=A0A420HSZ0_9PEZI|nr:NADPH-dependent 1-acyldihydroxyacetone phosphate reductase [Erysiphe neolycopersici]
MSQKTVLITGCSPGGIGHALALEFHSHSLHVIATARNKELLENLEKLGLSTLELDVTNPQSISTALSSVRDITNGHLDILVNNAGRICVMPGVEIDLDDARQTFETNFFGVIAVTQAFVPLLINARGLILNIGSIAAIVPLVFASIYNASKAALHAYSQTLRLELEPFDVKVMVVITGGVQSHIGRKNVSSLRQNSLYLDIKQSFDRRLRLSQENPLPNKEYAMEVVKAALKGPKAPKWLWKGKHAWFVWLYSRLFGTWWFDRTIPQQFGLTKLCKLVRERRQKSS